MKKLLLYISLIVFAIYSSAWSGDRWTPIYEDNNFYNDFIKRFLILATTPKRNAPPTTPPTISPNSV